MYYCYRGGSYCPTAAAPHAPTAVLCTPVHPCYCLAHPWCCPTHAPTAIPHTPLLLSHACPHCCPACTPTAVPHVPPLLSRAYPCCCPREPLLLSHARPHCCPLCALLLLPCTTHCCDWLSSWLVAAGCRSPFVVGGQWLSLLSVSSLPPPLPLPRICCCRLSRGQLRLRSVVGVVGDQCVGGQHGQLLALSMWSVVSVICNWARSYDSCLGARSAVCSMAVIVVAVVGRVVTVVVVMVITAMLSQLLRPSSSQLLPPCCRSRHGRVVMVVVVVAVAVVAAMLAQLSQPLWLLLSWPSWCRCCGIAVSLLQSLWPCCRSRCGHHCHGWSWSVVVAISGQSLSVGDRRQLPLLVMAVIITYLL
jgi:hypothetical protein